MYVVKVFLESSFYHHVEIVAEGFVALFTDNHFHPSPLLAANWPLIGTKLNCRRPLTNFMQCDCFLYSSFFQKYITKLTDILLPKCTGPFLR